MPIVVVVWLPLFLFSQVRNASCHAVANFSAVPTNHRMIVEEGALQPLLLLLSCGDHEATLRAVSALRGLSIDEQVRCHSAACREHWAPCGVCVSFFVLPPLATRMP